MRSLNVIRVALLVLAVAPPTLAQAGSDGPSAVDEAVALTGRGFTYAKSGQYEKTVEALTRAIRLNPKSAEAHYFLGAAYNNMDRFEQAIREFREAVRSSRRGPKPTVVWAWRAAGRASRSRSFIKLSLCR